MRAGTAAAGIPFSVGVMPADELRTTPATTLDSALRSYPGFSLFRRSDSLTANPTAQGVSLRGVGPSGASRSLVLLDGLPLNDPFGGWISWSKLPRESLARVEFVPGGGATAWGNAALGGVVNLLTDPMTANGGRVSASAGDFGMRSVEAAVGQQIGPGHLRISGRWFAIDGFRTVAAERHGPIDKPAGGRHAWLGADWNQPVGTNARLTLSTRAFEEERANGTPYQRNASDELFGAATLRVEATDRLSWQVSAYAQDQGFSSTFSSVNATRTAETPASDQFAVPSTAGGIAATAHWTHAQDARTSVGLDARTVRGETRENFSFVNGAFTRQRVAGGTQTLWGAFWLHERPLRAGWTGSVGLRADEWRETDGHRRESDRATGLVSRDDQIGTRRGTAFSPSAGLVWKANEHLRWRLAAQQAFRRPTLNELYRPFRVGNVITEANPSLRTETTTSAEVGVETAWTTVKLGATVFWNALHDAVGNVTVARGPGVFSDFGQIPAGGLGRRRLNMERVEVRGLELSGEWQAAPTLSLHLAVLLNDTTVREASAAPQLEGLHLAQVPQVGASASLGWQPARGWTVAPRVRYVGAQFEDDENVLRLAPAWIGDLTLSYTVTPHWELFARLENLGDARIETGRSADGLVNTGTPRLFTSGARLIW